MTKSTTLQAAFQRSMADSATLPPKQKKVLAASLALFAEKGFANTSTKEIAERAGVAEGTVYRRYKTKDDLLLAVLRPLVTDVMPDLMKEFSEQVINRPYVTRREFLSVMIRDRLDFLHDNWQVVKVMLSEMMVNADLRQPMVERVVQLLQEHVYPEFDRLKATHELVDWPNDMLTQFIVGTVFVNLLRSGLQQDMASLITRADYLIDFLDQGLAPRPTE